jgi:hypothetical protein
MEHNFDMNIKQIYAYIISSLAGICDKSSQGVIEALQVRHAPQPMSTPLRREDLEVCLMRSLSF